MELQFLFILVALLGVSCQYPDMHTLEKKKSLEKIKSLTAAAEPKGLLIHSVCFTYDACSVKKRGD